METVLVKRCKQIWPEYTIANGLNNGLQFC